MTPLLILLQREDHEFHIQLLEMGLDNVLIKPVSEREIAARVSSLLKKSARSSNQVQLTLGNLKLNLNRMECLVQDKSISLSVLEFKLLWFLMENQGEVMDRKQILKEVWNNLEVTVRTVDNHIFCLRKKLKASDIAIQSLYGVGYSLRLKDLEGRAELDSPVDRGI